MVDTIKLDIEDNTNPTTAKRLRLVVADAFSFIRSVEANQALAYVSLDELIQTQIERNGDTERSNASQYDPYNSIDETAPAGQKPAERANFLGVADTQRPTKLDRIIAIQIEISSVIEEVKKTKPVDVADSAEYLSSIQNTVPLG